MCVVRMRYCDFLNGYGLQNLNSSLLLWDCALERVREGKRQDGITGKEVAPRSGHHVPDEIGFCQQMHLFRDAAREGNIHST